jgi:hypothetical protein
MTRPSLQVVPPGARHVGVAWAVLSGGLFEVFPTEAAAIQAARTAAAKAPGTEVVVYAPTRRFRAALVVDES